MNKLNNLLKILISLSLITACKSPWSMKTTSESSDSTEPETKEIKISCGESTIDAYLDDGWIVKKEYSEEKVCSWKTEKANKKCDIDKDKGCLITKPDVIGETTIYLLERTNSQIEQK